MEENEGSVIWRVIPVGFNGGENFNEDDKKWIGEEKRWVGRILCSCFSFFFKKEYYLR